MNKLHLPETYKNILFILFSTNLFVILYKDYKITKSGGMIMVDENLKQCPVGIQTSHTQIVMAFVATCVEAIILILG